MELEGAYPCINFYHYALKNLSKLWIDGDINLRQRFQQIVFPEKFSFNGEFIGTEQIACKFKLLRPKTTSVSNLATRVGFEPAAFSLGSEKK